MARKSSVLSSEPEAMPGDVRDRLVRILDNMATRKPHLEPVIMQIARAGELSEVEAGIVQRREYAKRARGPRVQ